MIKTLRSLSICILMSCAAHVAAQDIVSHLDSCSNVELQQDPRITQLIAPSVLETDNPANPNVVLTGTGYRIRVFSGNKQSASKARAYKIQEELQKEDEELTTYVIFKTPFWRLLVGDYRTAEEANSKLRALRSQFPQYAGDMFIVKDEIVL